MGNKDIQSVADVAECIFFQFEFRVCMAAHGLVKDGDVGKCRFDL